MLLALEFLLVGQFLPSASTRSCALMWAASGPVGSPGRRRPRGADRARRARRRGRTKSLRGSASARGERPQPDFFMPIKSSQRRPTNRRSRGKPPTETPERISSKYQRPSAVSPNSTAPTSRPPPITSFLVAAKTGVGEHDLLGAGRAKEIAGREHVDARHFEVGRQHAAGIARARRPDANASARACS